MKTYKYISILVIALNLILMKAAVAAGLYATNCNDREPQLVFFLEQTGPAAFKVTFVSPGKSVRQSTTTSIRELQNGYGEFRMANNDVMIFRPKQGIQFVEFNHLYLNGSTVINNGQLNGRSAILERCPESSAAKASSPAENYAIAAVRAWGAKSPQDSALNAYKARCDQYLNAKQRCATAGDMNRCMDTLAPGYKSYGIDPALCGFVPQR